MRIPFKIETGINKILKPNLFTVVTTYIDGKKSSELYGKSLVANFLQRIYNQYNNGDTDFAVPTAPFSARNNVGVRTTGSILSVTGATININGNANDSTKGIVIGTGSTAVTPSDYVLVSQCVQGVGANQFQHGAQSAPIGTGVSGSVTSFQLRREFVNGSGSSIAVREIGIYGEYSGSFFMDYREVLGSADNVPNGSTYRVDITFSITT